MIAPAGSGGGPAGESARKPRVVVEDAWVPARDGVRLATDVVLLEDGEPKPALVVRVPYGRPSARQLDPVGLARAGWAVVLQESRGQFDSEGELDLFRQEGPDGADTIAWAAAQPWCDGRVAGFGGSYGGMTQWLAALEGPPALRAITPMMSGGSVREYFQEGGAYQLGLLGHWAPFVRAGEAAAAVQTRLEAQARAFDADEVYRTPLGKSPLWELAPWSRKWLDSAPDYWAGLDVLQRPERITVPSYIVAGWYDVFCEGDLAVHRAVRTAGGSDAARAGQRLVVGPWTHGAGYLPATSQFDFGPEANGLVLGLPARMLEWLRGAVDGAQVEGGVRAFVMGAETGRGGRWREWDVWPPPTTPTTLYLGARAGANSVRGDGALSFDAPADAGADSWTHDPDDPVPTWGGRGIGAYRPLAGPVDQAPVEAREDVLVYTSAPLERGLTVAGAVTANLVASSSAPSFDLTVKLVDVWPDGRAFNIVDSVRRVTAGPGTPVTVEVAVGSTAHRFAQGHRVRIQVASSNWPQRDLNPSSDVPAAEALVFAPARQTLHHGGPEPSRIQLPVLEGD